MSTRPEITAKLSELTEEHIAPHRDVRYYWAKEVTFDHGTGHSVRVDYMQFKPINNSVSGIEKGSFYAYEIKSSVEDFNSKNGHNMIADYNYYVMPLEVFEAVKDKIPYDIGVLTPAAYRTSPDKWAYLTPVKKARRKDRARPITEMLLMMFRSCARDRKPSGEERKMTQGTWKLIDMSFIHNRPLDGGECSVCRFRTQSAKALRFCPNCGAGMRVPDANVGSKKEETYDE